MVGNVNFTVIKVMQFFFQFLFQRATLFKSLGHCNVIGVIPRYWLEVLIYALTFYTKKAYKLDRNEKYTTD